MDMFFLYLLPDNISVINYILTNAEFILGIKIFYIRKSLKYEQITFYMGIKQICLI